MRCPSAMVCVKEARALCPTIPCQDGQYVDKFFTVDPSAEMTKVDPRVLRVIQVHDELRDGEGGVPAMAEARLNEARKRLLTWVDVGVHERFL